MPRNTLGLRRKHQNSKTNPSVKPAPVRHDRNNSASPLRRVGSYRAACRRIETRCEFDRLIKSAWRADLHCRMAGHPGTRHVVICRMKHRPTAGCRRTTGKIYGRRPHRINPTCYEMQRRLRAMNGVDKGGRPWRGSREQAGSVMSRFRFGRGSTRHDLYIFARIAERVAGNNARCAIFICGIEKFGRSEWHRTSIFQTNRFRELRAGHCGRSRNEESRGAGFEREGLR